MPYPRIDPATVEEMFKDSHPGHFSICQYLRDIHQGIEDESIREKVRYCWAWAKRMHNHIKKLEKKRADNYIERMSDDSGTE